MPLADAYAALTQLAAKAMRAAVIVADAYGRDRRRCRFGHAALGSMTAMSTRPMKLRTWTLAERPELEAQMWAIGDQGMPEFMFHDLTAALYFDHGEGGGALFILVVLAAGALGGMAWAAIPAFLRTTPAHCAAVLRRALSWPRRNHQLAQL